MQMPPRREDDGLVAAMELRRLEDYVRFWREKGEGAAIAVHRIPDPELIKQGDRYLGTAHGHARSVLDTVATDGALVVQVNVRPVSGWPPASLAVAVS